MRAFARLLPWLVLILAVIDWIGLKSGRLTHPPWLLTVLVGGAMALLVARLALALVSLRSDRRSRGSALGE